MQHQCNINATTSRQQYLDELTPAFRMMKRGNISLNRASTGVVFHHRGPDFGWQKVGENPYNPQS
jgi:hypothetical protein